MQTNFGVILYRLVKSIPRNNRAINKNIINAPSRSITTQIDTVYSQSSRSKQTEEKAQEKEEEEEKMKKVSTIHSVRQLLIQ